ncbi:hypothetical protein FACS1894102_1640 [Spirochaetia bacterium]|nr:hypothetical protein FACS1894102_1640 [Spirochaetia bacterium]
MRQKKKKNKNMKSDNKETLSPGRALFIFFLATFIYGSFSFFIPEIVPHFVDKLFIIIGILIIFDAIQIFFLSGKLSVSREMSNSLSLGINANVKLNISGIKTGKIRRKLKIFDIYDDTMGCDAMPIIYKFGGKSAQIKADNKAATLSSSVNNKVATLSYKLDGDNVIFTYKVLPVMRGNWEFQRVEILKSSILRFWRLKIVCNCSTKGKTYPNFKILTRQESLNAILQQSGEKNLRKRGTGMEFEDLREWQTGDSSRSIDWRATARRKKLIVRQYQEEQDQNVLIILDSGFRLHRLDGVSKSGGSGLIQFTQFDFALNGGLLLAYSALKHGDAVGVQVFGKTDLWLPPHNGVSTFGHLMNSLYDVQSSGMASSQFSALSDAVNRLKRRTFIVMISNFRPEDRQQMSWVLPQISRRHLLLLVSMRESDAERIANRIDTTGTYTEDEMLETAAARSYLRDRAALYKEWNHLGLLTLESSAENLSAAIINRYLAVKRSALL